jgi:hypothetical protein
MPAQQNRTSIAHFFALKPIHALALAAMLVSDPSVHHPSRQPITPPNSPYSTVVFSSSVTYCASLPSPLPFVPLTHPLPAEIPPTLIRCPASSPSPLPILPVAPSSSSPFSPAYYYSDTQHCIASAAHSGGTPTSLVKYCVLPSAPAAATYASLVSCLPCCCNQPTQKVCKPPFSTANQQAIATRRAKSKKKVARSKRRGGAQPPAERGAGVLQVCYASHLASAAAPCRLHSC